MDTIAALLERAKRATGLSNFGDDSFREGLEVLLVSAAGEARHNEMGRAALEAQIVDLLTKRLQIEDWYARYPQIDEQEIIAPLMVLGLPRTGSTALHCLLAEDPAARVIRNWEGLNPIPPPEAATRDSDPRIAIMEGHMERRSKLFPRMRQMLPSTATSPVEDQLLMGYDFKSQIFQASHRIPSYAAWLNRDADLVPTFRYVKRVLKLLQWRCPPTCWRLKNPTYSLFIDAVDEVFPDARYCMTHRDVAAVIPSVADLYYEMSKGFTHEPDMQWFGRVNIEWCDLGMHRMIAFRERGNESRFFDINFAPFQRDPFPVIERLYAFIGEDFAPETRHRMEDWRRNTPREKHGAHEYDPADFGLDPAALRERFLFYSNRFEVPPTAY